MSENKSNVTYDISIVRELNFEYSYYEVAVLKMTYVKTKISKQEFVTKEVLSSKEDVIRFVTAEALEQYLNTFNKFVENI